MERIIAVVCVSVVVAVVIGILAGMPIFFLWNWLMPEIFDLPSISFLQAIGLSVLSSCLFSRSSASSD